MANKNLDSLGGSTRHIYMVCDLSNREWCYLLTKSWQGADQKTGKNSYHWCSTELYSMLDRA